MPYKDRAARNARAREYLRRRRLTDPVWVERERKRQRERARREYAAGKRRERKRNATVLAQEARNRRRRRRARREDARRQGLAAWSLILEFYGAVCACCGEARREFLTLDHVNGRGAVARQVGKIAKNERHRVAMGLRRGFVDPTVRVLCWNCNCARGVFGVCHPDGPLAPQPRPDPPLLGSNGVEHGARGGAPRPSHEQLSLLAP